MSDFTAKLRPQYDGRAILAQERRQSPLDVTELSHHLLSRDGFLERQSRIVTILATDALFDKKNQLNLSRPARFHLGLARTKKLRRLAHAHGWSAAEYVVAEYLVDEMSPYHLHWGMFTSAIQQQGTEAQRAEWLPRAGRFEVLGCYAQTEMGHGSNVRGLETTAEYDVTSREWVLHSPSLTSAKWWPGGLGRVATHAIVVAQLRTKGVGHGPHQFLCRIRHEKTHEPLPGLVIGDIGPKYG
jgi:acyl-CoA oxidase